MFFDRSAQRIFVGGSNSVYSNSRLVFMPASLTVLSNFVPTPTGPSVSLRISWTRGLNLGSLVPSARNANTASAGRSTTADPIISLAMCASLLRLARAAGRDARRLVGHLRIHGWPRRVVQAVLPVAFVHGQQRL